MMDRQFNTIRAISTISQYFQIAELAEHTLTCIQSCNFPIRMMVEEGFAQLTLGTHGIVLTVLANPTTDISGSGIDSMIKMTTASMIIAVTS